MHDALTFNDALSLADIVRGVQSHAKLEWYPLGTMGESGSLRSTQCEMRAITTKEGYFLPHGADIRDGYVWTSGIMEHFIPVPDAVRALQNALDARHGSDQPMAVIKFDA